MRTAILRTGPTRNGRPVPAPIGDLWVSASGFLGTQGDSDVSKSGTTSRTDYTDQLIRLAERSEADGFGVWLDGQYANSDPARLGDNSYWVGKNCAGIIRMAGTRRPLLVNSNRDPSAYGNSNIHIENLTLNGNAYLLTGDGTKFDSGTEYGADNGIVYLFDVWFSGVDGVRLYNTRHYKSRTFAVMLNTVKNLRILDAVIDQGDAPAPASNRDGIHLIGPVSNFLIRGCTIRSGDDAIALNADEAAPVPTIWTYGAITDGAIENLYLDNGSRGGSYGCNGVRMLSQNNIIDRVRLTGLYGVTTRTYLQIDNFPTNALGPGAFGDITIEKVNVQFAGPTGTVLGQTEWGGAFRSLTIRDLHRNESQYGETPSFYFDAGTDIGTLEIDGFGWKDDSAAAGEHIVFKGKADLVRLVNVKGERDPSRGHIDDGGLLHLNTGSPLRGVGRLELIDCDVANKNTLVYHESGYLGELAARGCRQEYSGYGLYFSASGMVLPRFGASGNNVANLVAPMSAGTVGAKYGPDWNAGATAGARFVTGVSSAYLAYDAALAKYTTPACTTAATADGAAVQGWLDGPTGRGRLLGRSSNNPVLKTAIIGANPVVRFTRASSHRLDAYGFWAPAFGVLMLVVPRSTTASQCYLTQMVPGTFEGWALGVNDSDGTKAKLFVARDNAGGHAVTATGGTLASGTATILGASYDPITGVAKLYQAATGDSAMTLIDTQTLTGGVMPLAGTVGTVGGLPGGAGQYSDVDVGWLGYYDFAPTAAQLDAELGILRTLKGL